MWGRRFREPSEDPCPQPTSEPPATATRLLPLSQLIRLSVYWLGLVAVFQGIGLIMQERIKDLVPDEAVQYTTLGIDPGRAA